MAIEWTCRSIAWYAENLKWLNQKVYEIDLARNIKPENLYPKYIKRISFPGYKLLLCANTLDFAGIKLPFTNLQFHCVKSAQIRSFFWSAFFCIWTEYREIRSISPYSLRMRKNTKYFYVFSPNAGKYGPEKTPYLDTFHAVFCRCGALQAEKEKHLNYMKITLKLHFNHIL